VWAQTAKAAAAAAAVAAVADTASGSTASALAVRDQTVDLVVPVLGSTVPNARVVARAAIVALAQARHALRMEGKLAVEAPL